MTSAAVSVFYFRLLLSADLVIRRQIEVVRRVNKVFARL